MKKDEDSLSGHSLNTLRPSSEELLSFLQKSEYFREAEESSLVEIESSAQWMFLSSSRVLMRQGEAESRVFLLVSGKLFYEKRDSDGEVIAAGEFVSGEFVGEISYLKDAMAVATVYATRNCHLLIIEREHFEAFLLKNPQVLLSVARKVINIADRSLSHAPQLNRYTSLALFPLAASVPLADFSEKLSRALGHFGKCARISKNSDLTLKNLSQYASEFDFLLFEADPSDAKWSDLCVQEADRILLLAMGGGSPDITPLEERIVKDSSEFSPRAELVLLHKEGGLPSNTAAFLKSRKILRHHHVSVHVSSGYERLARVLTGNSIGIALGGGGVRAATQVGLFRALIEDKVPIDHVCGTSIGALVGAFFAAGFSTDEMEEIIHERIVRSNLFNDYVPPFVSLTGGDKFSQFLSDVFKGQLIEDMPLDYFSVATNLTKGRLETIDSGFAWKAVRASASLPAILPPMVIHSNLYVDGGLLDNLPGEVLRSRGVGKIIAVDVSSAVYTEGDAHLGALVRSEGRSPSLLQLLRNRFSGTRKKYSSLGDIILRSMVVGSRETAQRTKGSADLYIRMPVDDWGMLDFKYSADLVGVGYEYARRNLQEWKKNLMF